MTDEDRALLAAWRRIADSPGPGEVRLERVALRRLVDRYQAVLEAQDDP